MLNKEVREILAVGILFLCINFFVVRLVNIVKTQQFGAVRHVDLGLWTENFWDDTNKILNPHELLALEKKIQRKVAIAHYYRGWEYLESDALIKELDIISLNGWTPMLSANPYFFPGCFIQDKTLYKAIADGNCDEFLHRVAKNLKKYPNKFYFRFAWEMNLDSVQWSIQRTSSNPEDFVKAWRRFHFIMDAEGALNAEWVFCPQVEEGANTLNIETLYPGDEYVDWIGLDGYNWGASQSWSSWKSFSEIFKSSYEKLTKLAPDKPVMICEVNTTDMGGDKGEWYKEMFTKEIPSKFPKIKAVVLFNEDRTPIEGVNWLLDKTEDSLNQFVDGINHPIYN